MNTQMTIIKHMSCVLLLGIAAQTSFASETAIPNLLGTWSGDNNTNSEPKGYQNWQKTIEITEQKGRLFKGHFSYSGGNKHFFGVIYPDNTSFSWVAVDSKGYNHGRIHSPSHISACYIEAGADATAGCADLSKQAPKP